MNFWNFVDAHPVATVFALFVVCGTFVEVIRSITGVRRKKQ